MKATLSDYTMPGHGLGIRPAGGSSHGAPEGRLPPNRLAPSPPIADCRRALLQKETTFRRKRPFDGVLRVAPLLSEHSHCSLPVSPNTRPSAPVTAHGIELSIMLAALPLSCSAWLPDTSMLPSRMRSHPETAAHSPSCTNKMPLPHLLHAPNMALVLVTGESRLVRCHGHAKGW